MNDVKYTEFVDISLIFISTGPNVKKNVFSFCLYYEVGTTISFPFLFIYFC